MEYLEPFVRPNGETNYMYFTDGYYPFKWYWSMYAEDRHLYNVVVDRVPLSKCRYVKKKTLLLIDLEFVIFFIIHHFSIVAKNKHLIATTTN